MSVPWNVKSATLRSILTQPFNAVNELPLKRSEVKALHLATVPQRTYEYVQVPIEPNLSHIL